MLKQLMQTIFSVIFRVLLLAAGLVFMASLFVAVLLLLGVWLVRALWARLTGQAVRPWTFQVNRQEIWSRFYRAPGQGPSSKSDDTDVVDVEIKEIRASER